MEIFPGLTTTTDPVQTAKSGFWRRQFFGPRTDSQLTFDLNLRSHRADSLLCF